MTTKAQFIARLSENTNLSKKQATVVLEEVSRLITDDLIDNGEALIPGIGKLKVKERGERQGRNPRTGETLTIAARKVARFSASRHLKQAVSE